MLPAEARPLCGLCVLSAWVGVAGSSQMPSAHPARAPGPRSPGGGVILTWRTHPPRVPARRSGFLCLEKAEAQRGRESPRDQPTRTRRSQAGALAPRAAGEGHSRAGGEARSLRACLAQPVCSAPLWPSRAIFGAGAGLPGPHPRPQPLATLPGPGHPRAPPHPPPTPESPGTVAGRAGGSLRSQPTPNPNSALSFRLGSPFPRGGTGPTRANEEEEGEMTKYPLSSRHLGGRIHQAPAPRPPPPVLGGRTHVHVSHWGRGPRACPCFSPHHSVTSRKNRNPFLNPGGGPRTLPRKARAALFPRSPRDPRAQPAIE